jgi:arylsulfatase A-like enzyme
MLIRYPEKLGNKKRIVRDPIGTPDLLPTLLGLSGLAIPSSVEGKDYSSQLLSGKDLDNEAVLITLPVPFHEWQFMNGGREYRGVRTRKYTYVRDLKGPWLLYDNEKDPFQLLNLVNQPGFSTLQGKLEVVLERKLREVKDEFLPADEYMKKWNYLYDRSDSLRPIDYLDLNR